MQAGLAFMFTKKSTARRLCSNLCVWGRGLEKRLHVCSMHMLTSR